MDNKLNLLMRDEKWEDALTYIRSYEWYTSESEQKSDIQTLRTRQQLAEQTDFAIKEYGDGTYCDTDVLRSYIRRIFDVSDVNWLLNECNGFIQTYYKGTPVVERKIL